jgi:hypothetical protein
VALLYQHAPVFGALDIPCAPKMATSGREVIALMLYGCSTERHQHTETILSGLLHPAEVTIYQQECPVQWLVPH